LSYRPTKRSIVSQEWRTDGARDRIFSSPWQESPDYCRPPRTDVMRSVLKPSQCIRPA